jgi:hypothetical protein
VRVDAPFVRLVRVARVLFAIVVSQISTGKQFTSSQAGVSSEQTGSNAHLPRTGLTRS